MNRSNNTLKYFSIIGFLFVLIVGTLFHFLYDWSNQNALVGLFTPVNESVWEHFKLGFYAFLLYSALAYPFVANKVNNYVFATAMGSFILNLTILLGYLAYTSVTKNNIFFLDILLFVIGIILAFFTFYQIATSDPLPQLFNWIGLLIILTTISLFIAFTISPPTQFEIFRDPSTYSFLQLPPVFLMH